MAISRVRSGRSAQVTLTRVVVLGRGAMAEAVAARLEEVAAVPEVVRLQELARQEPAGALTGADALVVLADEADFGAWLATPSTVRRRQLADRIERAFRGARGAKVPHVVVISSAIVHGASAERAVIDDDEPVPDLVENGLAGELREAEGVLAGESGRRGPRLTVLRPASVVGPGIDTMIVRHFEVPRLLAVRGTRREWQFCHVEDVAGAVEHVLRHRLTGALTVGSDGALSHEDVERLSGVHTMEVPVATAFATAHQLHRTGVLPAPADDLAYAVYPWTVTSARLRASGWTPRWSNEECLAALLEESRGRLGVAGRRVGTRDAAAVSAAGAVVVVLGTAAVVRRTRQRRRG